MVEARTENATADRFTDEITKRRRQTRYRMTEEDARARFSDDAVQRAAELFSLYVRSVNARWRLLSKQAHHANSKIFRKP